MSDTRARNPPAQASATRPKTFRQGTDRICPPEETLERVWPLLQACGITRVANLTGLDRVGIPVVAVCRPNTRSIAVAQGKGSTLAAAKASGIMEAIEAFHAESVVLPLVRSSMEDLARQNPVVDVSRLPRTSVERFGTAVRTLWTKARNIADDDSDLWVPYEMVHTDYTLPLPDGSGCFLISSNGLASGNSFEEAVSHGLCELIERDATTVHGFGPAEARAERRVDLLSVSDELSRQTLDLFERAGVAVAVTDVTSDVGVAAFRCDVADKDGGELPPLRGTGCHPRREIALLRALNEAAQTRLTMISGSRDDLSPWWYADRDRVEQSRRRFFEELNRPAARNFAQISDFDGETVGHDLGWLVARLRAVGFAQVCVADLTRPELGVPVARVIVPGLEPMAEAPGYLPGERVRRLLREPQ